MADNKSMEIEGVNSSYSVSPSTDLEGLKQKRQAVQVKLLDQLQKQQADELKNQLQGKGQNLDIYA